MKNAKIFHGTGCTPDSYWFPYLKKELERRDYQVSVPQLPDTDFPDLKKWLPLALAQGVYDKDTVLIGHSAGGPLVLSVLETIKVPIRAAILVAGYARPKGEKKEAEKILQPSYDWGKIKGNVTDIYFINSDNDPWGCNDVEGRHMLDHIGGTLIIKHGEGHMGSDTFKQPYKEFPLLVKLIE
jgi:predicted alpha/beta hydrolase family esterase